MKDRTGQVAAICPASTTLRNEAEHPKTKHGANKDGPCRKFCDTENIPSFVEDTVAKTGMSERKIQQSVHRAESNRLPDTAKSRGRR